MKDIRSQLTLLRCYCQVYVYIVKRFIIIYNLNLFRKVYANELIFNVIVDINVCSFKHTLGV